MDKSIYYLKKTLFLFNGITRERGSILFFSPNAYYFNNIKKEGKVIRENNLLEVSKGIFSNHLNNQYSTFPDIVLIFDFNNNYSYIKELKILGIPIVGVIEKSSIVSLIEYPIILNIFSYFTNFFLLSLCTVLGYVKKLSE